MWYGTVGLSSFLKGPLYNYYTDGSEGSNLTHMSKSGLSVSMASMFSGSHAEVWVCFYMHACECLHQLLYLFDLVILVKVMRRTAWTRELTGNARQCGSSSDIQMPFYIGLKQSLLSPLTEVRLDQVVM